MKNSQAGLLSFSIFITGAGLAYAMGDRGIPVACVLVIAGVWSYVYGVISS